MGRRIINFGASLLLYSLLLSNLSAEEMTEAEQEEFPVTLPANDPDTSVESESEEVEATVPPDDLPKTEITEQPPEKPSDDPSLTDTVPTEPVPFTSTTEELTSSEADEMPSSPIAETHLTETTTNAEEMLTEHNIETTLVEPTGNTETDLETNTPAVLEATDKDVVTTESVDSDSTGTTLPTHPRSSPRPLFTEAFNPSATGETLVENVPVHQEPENPSTDAVPAQDVSDVKAAAFDSKSTNTASPIRISASLVLCSLAARFMLIAVA